ncbi:MAG: hypothetical protein HY974_02575 [Candidatus Kerfeldbacteria bacterium]|nr:hypothetical protein [Candidatus Kerfeldbacteria bacterium]
MRKEGKIMAINNQQEELTALRQHWADMLPRIRGQDITLHREDDSRTTWGRLHIMDYSAGPPDEPWEIVLITTHEHIHINADNPWRVQTIHN